MGLLEVKAFSGWWASEGVLLGLLLLVQLSGSKGKDKKRLFCYREKLP